MHSAATPESPYTDETPVHPDDAANFVEGVSFATKDAVYQAEMECIQAAVVGLYASILDGTLTARDLCQNGVLQDIHEACYGPIWKWAGQIRTRELSLGVAPESIRERLAAEVGNFEWWVNSGKDPHWIAMNVHHRTVFIHPFVDGNGRVTRIYADALLLALTKTDVFDWVKTPEYFAGLREADRTMDASSLVQLIGVNKVEFG
jgi:fido (protein-threonine AMPylation protein)